MVSRSGFRKRYIKESKITEKEFNKDFIVLPCKCNSEDCEGYGVYNIDPRSIKSYFDLHCPEERLLFKDIIFIIKMGKLYTETHNDSSFENDVLKMVNRIKSQRYSKFYPDLKDYKRQIEL